jgi:hypothetical protein
METKHHINLLKPVTQSGDQTLNNPIRRKWFALALSGLLFTSIFALSAPLVEAGCQQWDVSGQWELRFNSGANSGAIVKVNLQQQGANLSGIGEFPQAHGVGGQISGNITVNAFAMTLTADTVVYRFLGTVDSTGKMEGTARRSSGKIERLTDDGAHWVSSRRMKCADENPPISKQKTDASPTSSAEAKESSSSDTEDQPGKHKNKNKKKNKHHHHHDDDQDQGND